MQVGVYVDGRPLEFNEVTQLFSIGNVQVSHAQVAGYDRAGELTWATNELRNWFYQLLSRTPPAIQAPVRKRRRAGLIVVIVALVLLSCCGISSCLARLGSDATGTSSSNSGASQDQTSTSSSSSGGNQGQATAEPVIKVGQSFSTDKYEITVTAVEVKSKVGSEYFDSKPAEGGVYVAVQWKYKNITNKPISSFWNSFTVNLIDPNGTKFSSDVNASSSYATEIDPTRKVISDLNPGITVSGGTVFEVAKDSFSKDNWTLLVEGQKVSLK